MSAFSSFVCLSGLPRSGSTLLSAILSQNPLIHAEGNSAVCQLMWDMQQSCLTNAKEQLTANGRQHTTVNDLIAHIPHLYYKNNAPGEKIVVDKCRSWTIPANIQLLKTYIDKNIKIIILERSVKEIVASFLKLYKENTVSEEQLEQMETALLAPKSEPIMRSIIGINWAKKNNQENTFLFISYNDLIGNPENTVKKIYDFCGWEYFDHDYMNIVSKYPENDEIYKMKGQHTIRTSIKKCENTISLSEKTLKQCETIDTLMHYL
jgi:sulfotransferase